LKLGGYTFVLKIFYEKILFVWISAHYRMGNEIANFLAKTERPTDDNFEISIKDFRNIYKLEAWIIHKIISLEKSDLKEFIISKIFMIETIKIHGFTNLMKKDILSVL